jgi:hypothetical protein
MTIITLNLNENSPFNKNIFSKIAVVFFSAISILLVSFQRIVVNSHTLFDVIFACGCGVMIFWLIYVIPYDVHNVNDALNKVLSVFFLFVGVFLFYSKDPTLWIILSFSLMAALIVLERSIKIFASIKEKIH